MAENWRRNKALTYKAWMAAMRASTLMGTTFAAACLAAGGAGGAATARAASAAYRSAARPAGMRRQHRKAGYSAWRDRSSMSTNHRTSVPFHSQESARLMPGSKCMQTRADKQAVCDVHLPQNHAKLLSALALG